MSSNGFKLPFINNKRLNKDANTHDRRVKITIRNDNDNLNKTTQSIIKEHNMPKNKVLSLVHK